jgi:hypothetical protein
LQKNATLGLLFKENLNPVGERKFLFSICVLLLAIFLSI